MKSLLARLILPFASAMVAATVLPAQGGNPSPPDTGANDGMVRIPSGSWGDIEFFYFYIEASDSLMERFPLPSPRTRWVFPASEAPMLQDTLVGFGIAPEVIGALLTPKNQFIDEDRVVLLPPIEVLDALTPDARSRLYRMLRNNGLNPFHANPVYLLSGEVDTWARDSDLPDSAVQQMKRHVYDLDGILAFSDVHALLASASSDAEARLIYKKLTRTRTLMARLRIDASSDIDSILDYWSTGLGLRRKDIEPLLRAVMHTPGAQHLGLTHLLPPLPRKLLYSYPDLAMMAQGALPDCHWTTLNFFNYDPEYYYLDSRAATSAVLENFEKVSPPYRFGDVLMFMDQEGLARHSCNYLAGDIVFTKNGRNPATPWALMELADLRKMYRANTGEVRIQGYRHKKAVAAGK